MRNGPDEVIHEMIVGVRDKYHKRRQHQPTTYEVDYPVHHQLVR